MQKITIVTSNPGKLSELRALDIGKIDFDMLDLEINEIQSLDLENIVRN